MKNSQKGFIIPLLIIIIAALIIGGGVYVYRKNQHINVTSSNSISEIQASNLAVNALIQAKLTSLSKDCLSTNISDRTEDTITFEIREVHGDMCGGDPSTAPLVNTIEVNLKTQKVSAVDPTTGDFKVINSTDNSAISTTTQSNNEDINSYAFSEAFQTPSRIFYCQYRMDTESDCSLFVSDKGSETKKDTGLEDNMENFLLSPDSNHILEVQEHEAIVLDTRTLTQKIILQVPENESLGTYSDFPTFENKAKWLNNSQINFSIYDSNNAIDSTGTAKPIAQKVVSI